MFVQRAERAAPALDAWPFVAALVAGALSAHCPGLEPSATPDPAPGSASPLQQPGASELRALALAQLYAHVTPANAAKLAAAVRGLPASADSRAPVPAGRPGAGALPAGGPSYSAGHAGLAKAPMPAGSEPAENGGPSAPSEPARVSGGMRVAPGAPAPAPPPAAAPQAAWGAPEGPAGQPGAPEAGTAQAAGAAPLGPSAAWLALAARAVAGAAGDAGELEHEYEAHARPALARSAARRGLCCHRCPVSRTAGGARHIQRLVFVLVGRLTSSRAHRCDKCRETHTSPLSVHC